MSDVDTSAEAVERLARCLDGIARQTTVYPPLDRANAKDAAATLRALLAERDELRAEVERLRQENAAYNDEHEIMV